MNIILKYIFCFNMNKKEQREREVLVYVNEILEPNEMVGGKEEDNVESVWFEILCKNDKKIKLRNLQITRNGSLTGVGSVFISGN